MTPADFANLADLLYRRSGIALTPDKKALAKNRLTPIAQRFGFRDVSALLAELPYPTEELAHAITEAMTTNETSFFRDRAAFDLLADTVLPAVMRQRLQSRRLRIWCAACSTGQEAYSLAAMLDEAALTARGWRVDLIATDLSDAAIARAREGLYTPFEMERGLPLAVRDRCFNEEAGQWRVNDRLRRMVTFRGFNLLDHFGWLGEIDIVLCRNVLMYFEAGTKADILARLATTLSGDGYLLLGENEHASDQFAPVSAGRGLFMRVPVVRALRRAVF